MKQMKYLLFTLLAVTMVYCSPKTADKTAKTSMKGNMDENFRSEAPAPAPAPEIQIGDYQQYILDNGLTVIVVENDKVPRVSWQLTVDVPPLVEGEKAGMTSIAGDLLSRGTTNRTKAEIDQAIDYIGASLNTSASGLYAASLKKHQDDLLEVMSDVLLHPNFPEEEFEKLRKQVLSGLAQAKNDANSLSSSVGNRIVYGKDHPYGEMETEETVRNITAEDCKAYYQKYFDPSNAYLVVVGDITAEKAKQQAEKYFGDWKTGNSDEETDVEVPQSPGERSVSFINKEGAVQSVLRFAYPYELKPGDEDAIKVSVMNTLLGGFFNSRVNLNLREDKGYTYGARTSMGTDKYVASFNGSASVRNEVTDSSIQQFLLEVEKLQTELVSQEELDLVKAVVTGNFALALERPQTVASFALSTARYGLPQDYYKNYLKKVEAITPEDIRETANKYLQPYDLNIIVVGNEDEAAEKLVQFDDSGEISFYDAEGNLIEKNDTALPLGLDGKTVIENYLNAIGSADQRASINSLSMEYGIEAMGSTLSMKMVYDRPDKFMMTMTTQGMEMSKQVLNGDKGYMAQMGQKSPADEETIKSMQEQASLFEEEYFLENGYEFELKSIENIDGVNCYKVLVKDPEGTSKTVFFSQETGLKMRDVQTQEQNGQTSTIVVDYKDYKPVEGVLFPHVLVTSGALPFPLEAKLTNIEANIDVDESIFNVEE